MPEGGAGARSRIEVTCNVRPRLVIGPPRPHWSGALGALLCVIAEIETAIQTMFLQARRSSQDFEGLSNLRGKVAVARTPGADWLATRPLCRHRRHQRPDFSRRLPTNRHKMIF